MKYIDVVDELITQLNNEFIQLSFKTLVISDYVYKNKEVDVADEVTEVLFLFFYITLLLIRQS